jgi:hypothetical protein
MRSTNSGDHARKRRGNSGNAAESADAPGAVGPEAGLWEKTRDKRKDEAADDGAERSARDLLAETVLDAAMPPALRRRVVAGKAVAVILEVPSEAWVAPVAQAVRKLAKMHVCARDGSDRIRHRPDRGNDDVSKRLAGGRCVIGVSQEPSRLLPATLIGAADAHLRISPPTNADLAKVIAATARGPLPRLPAELASGLDADDLAAALRPGASARACVRRLTAAKAARVVTDPLVGAAPPLAALHGYGSAMQWATGLVRSLESWRAGRSPFPTDNAVVLAGDPGVGKNVLVRAISREARLPLVTTTVSSWFSTTSGYLDAACKAVDAVAAQARSLGAAGQGALVFFDEFDALPDRAALESRNRDFWLPLIVHTFLHIEQLARGPHVLIAATNHGHRIDRALLRPGRLGRLIRIERPDANAIVGILRLHLAGDLNQTDLAPVASLALGATGAEIENVVAKARAAADDAGRRVEVADLIAQLAPDDERPRAARWRSAVHEVAHALAALRLGAGTVERVSIVKCAVAGGHTLTTVDAETLSRDEIEAMVVVSLAGRAAEEALLGAATTGGGGSRASDLARATAAVASLHLTFGLGPDLSFRAAPDEALAVVAEDADLRRRIERDLRRLYRRALRLVRAERQVIEAVARRLVDARHFSGNEFCAAVRAAERSRRKRHG